MFRTHKFVALTLVSLAFVMPGCDEEVDLESDEHEEAIVDEDLEDARAAEEDEASELAPEGAQDQSAAEADPSAAVCRGFNNGANYCLALCNDAPVWRVVGHLTTIPYGSCVEAGVNLCAWHAGYVGACWGDP